MKTITLTLALICGGLFACLSNVIGQQVSPAGLPIYSQAQLRSYGLGIIKTGWRYGSANYSSDRPSTNAFGNTGAEAILDSLVSANFMFNDWNSSDMIGDQIILSDGEMSPWGYNNYAMVAAGFAYYPIGTNPAYHIVWLQDIPLLMFNNVRSAEVDALRPDGSVGNIWMLNTINGHPCLNQYFAGSENGVLVIHYLDGTMGSYPLSKPKPVAQSTAPFTGHAWKIAGHYVLKATSVKTTMKIVEQDNDPSVYGDIKFPLTSVTFDVMGVYQDSNGVTDTERPKTIEIDIVGGGHKSVRFNADRPTEVVLPKCAFRAWFTWVNFDKGNTLWTGDTGGVGVVSKPAAVTTK